jgi:hypothetical protein
MTAREFISDTLSASIARLLHPVTPADGNVKLNKITWLGFRRSIGTGKYIY